MTTVRDSARDAWNAGELLAHVRTKLRRSTRRSFRDEADEAEYVFTQLRGALVAGELERATTFGRRMIQLHGPRRVQTILDAHVQVLASIALQDRKRALRYMRREIDMLVYVSNRARVDAPIWAFCRPAFVVSRLEAWAVLLGQEDEQEERARIAARARRLRRMHGLQGDLGLLASAAMTRMPAAPSRARRS